MSKNQSLTIEVNKKVLMNGEVIDEGNESDLLFYLNKGYKVVDSCKGIIKEPFVQNVQDIVEIKSTHESKFIVTEVIASENDKVLNNKIDLLKSKDGTFKVTFDGIGVINKIHFSAGDTVNYDDVILSIATSKEVDTFLFLTNTTYILEKTKITL